MCTAIANSEASRFDARRGAQMQSTSLHVKEMTMRIPMLMIAGSLSVLPFAASADSGDVQYRFLDQNNGASTFTREEVRNEAAAAWARGELPLGERHVFKDEPSTRTRAEVIAEVREAGRMGLLFSVKGTPPTLTPAQAARIRAAGEAARPAAQSAQRQ
jgi:hypothetical protein